MSLQHPIDEDYWPALEIADFVPGKTFRATHVHDAEKDGVVSNNRRDNILALCKLCHSMQPAHSQMKLTPEERLTIERLRHEQGLRLNQSEIAGARVGAVISAHHVTPPSVLGAW